MYSSSCILYTNKNFITFTIYIIFFSFNNNSNTTFICKLDSIV